ncbi:MAG: phosphotransferase [Candidatus Falkowbacteria bacterium]|nr:phosphotransferase [Candidatus Falkowbacteria bacterium]
MNKIYKLLDEDFIAELFLKKVLPLYPQINKIEKIKITPYKKMIWETTYHVVFSYELFWRNSRQELKKIHIVCSAHSNEPRKNVLDTLNYLWDKGLPDENIKLPRPLFYIEDFQATFYRAVSGKTLLHLIKELDKEAVSALISGAAKMFAKLHQLPIDSSFQFNTSNQRISSVVPGEKFIYEELAARFKNGEDGDLAACYASCVAREKNLFPKEGERSLIHGDAHPENIIKVGENKIGLIDFTDFSPADFARDLGAFIQQIEYKIVRKAEDLEFAREMKKLFLVEYLKSSGKELNENLQERINLYYDWTALRTAVYWFLNHRSSPVNGLELLSAIHERQKTGRNAQDLMINYKS